MKSNLLLLGPACLLALLALGVAGLSFQHRQLTRELALSQATLAQIELRQNRIKALVNECIEHSRSDPDILPLLQSIGIKPANAPASPTAPNSPAPKPNGR